MAGAPELQCQHSIGAVLRLAACVSLCTAVTGVSRRCLAHLKLPPRLPAQQAWLCMEAVLHLVKLHPPLIGNMCSSTSEHCSSKWSPHSTSLVNCSLYKTWGPHLAALYGSHSAFDEIKVSFVQPPPRQTLPNTDLALGSCPCAEAAGMPALCMAGSTHDSPALLLLSALRATLLPSLLLACLTATTAAPSPPFAQQTPCRPTPAHARYSKGCSFGVAASVPVHDWHHQ